MECPVTLEPFEETGDKQPVILPACGHTLSKEAGSQLVEKAREKCMTGPKAVTIKCPTCSAKQKTMRSFRPTINVILFQDCITGLGDAHIRSGVRETCHKLLQPTHACSSCLALLFVHIDESAGECRGELSSELDVDPAHSC